MYADAAFLLFNIVYSIPRILESRPIISNSEAKMLSDFLISVQKFQINSSKGTTVVCSEGREGIYIY